MSDPCAAPLSSTGLHLQPSPLELPANGPQVDVPGFPGDTNGDDMPISKMFKREVAKVKPNLLVIMVKAERFPSGELNRWHLNHSTA